MLKKIVTIALLSLSLVSCGGESAFTYNNNIVDAQTQLIGLVENISNTIGSDASTLKPEDFTKVKAEIAKVTHLCDSVTGALSSNEKFKEDPYTKSVINVFNEYKTVVGTDMGTVLTTVEALSTKGEAAGDTEINAFNAALEGLETKLSSLDKMEDKLIQEQKAFASKNGFEVK